MVAIISTSSATLIIILVLGLATIFLISSIACLTLLLRRITRTIALYTFPKFGINNRKVERSWPQRREVRVPKSTWTRIIVGIENLSQLPNILLPPPVEKMPIKTKEGVLGWDWEQPNRPRGVIEESSTNISSRILQGNNRLMGLNNQRPAVLKEKSNPNKPIHFTRYIHVAFKYLVHILGDDKLDCESERKFVERKLIPGDFRFNEILLRNLYIYEKSKYGDYEIEKREYLEFINNLRRLIKMYEGKESSHVRRPSLDGLYRPVN